MFLTCISPFLVTVRTTDHDEILQGIMPVRTCFSWDVLSKYQLTSLTLNYYVSYMYFTVSSDREDHDEILQGIMPIRTCFSWGVLSKNQPTSLTLNYYVSYMYFT